MRGEDTGETKAATAEHLVHEYAREARQIAATVFLRNADTEEAKIGGFFQQLGRDRVGAFDFRHARIDALIDERLD